MEKFKLIICNDKNKWNSFIEDSPQGNIFCSCEFMDIWNKEYDLYFVLEKQNIMLGIPIIKRKTNSPPIAFMYQGIICSEQLSILQEHKKTKLRLELIEFTLKKLEEKYNNLSLCLHHSFEDLRAFQWFHYHTPKKGLFNIQLRYTGILDISKVNTFGEILSNSRTVRRQEYRKAVKEGFYIVETSDIETLDKLHDLTFKRQGLTRSANEKKLTRELAEDSLQKSYGRLLVCKDKNNTPVSAALFLFDNKCAYYLVGANDPTYRKFGTGAYVLYEQIKRSLDQGIDKIDFIGVNSPNRGDYKTSFNAKPTLYYSLNWESKNNEIS